LRNLLTGYELHKLAGKGKGTWSVWVSGNWRVTFQFDGPDAVNVDLAGKSRACVCFCIQNMYEKPLKNRSSKNHPRFNTLSQLFRITLDLKVFHEMA
jgi:hypothetical protein